jgi:hypothetical protein
MKAWRVLTQAVNVAIVLTFLISLIGLVTRVSAAITEFESATGMTADNDFGQRGVAISIIEFLALGVLAALSTWKLANARTSGFVWHSVLWLVLLMLATSGWLIFTIDLGPIRSSLQLLCLVGAISGITLSIVDARLPRHEEHTHTTP